ncbi:hypothetical protein CYMTET_8035 [Cymbomonas tetramitiformis]|uniref:Macro domain-containing protein n=1 Tax=Cymbomonas tetramitiformis TaxID=36881 RepID=A0AAE0GU95_9CHLO|nr:hypothetical protein CYMTET_8035 [Cymbomonas tetramitiformis]
MAAGHTANLGARLGLQARQSYRVANTTVFISQGSVLDFEGDAIVNAANTGCLGGGGLDGAISQAGGPELLAARQALPELDRGVRCPTGEARITVGGRLRNKWCIHAVGPNFIYHRSREGDARDEFAKEDGQLKNAYRHVLQLANQEGVQTLATCLLSSGIFRGDRGLDAVITMACESILTTLSESTTSVKEMHISAFTNEETSSLLAAADKANVIVVANLP